ncbi:phospholipid-binding protein [Kamptonema formosum]|uniref:phospholipid-binding protein n=1 Tax=Kamptonema formosum TaxID=331992 RepID=UPI00034C8247|nr:phospholipid-binding protein [Oscillatoria sp. PCC 10802]
MGWLQRLFGLEKPQTEPATVEGYSVPAEPQKPGIPPERLGLEGEYDDSGLAKRVALAFDQNPDVANLDRVWVAQTGSKVVLKGDVPDLETLNKLVDIASGVYGAGDVNTDGVNVG